MRRDIQIDLGAAEVRRVGKSVPPPEPDPDPPDDDTYLDTYTEVY